MKRAEANCPGSFLFCVNVNVPSYMRCNQHGNSECFYWLWTESRT